MSASDRAFIAIGNWYIDIRCDPLPKVGLLSRRKFYVKVIVDEVVRKTGLSESKARAWDWTETFHL